LRLIYEVGDKLALLFEYLLNFILQSKLIYKSRDVTISNKSNQRVYGEPSARSPSANLPRYPVESATDLTQVLIDRIYIWSF
jgi:hypothetical protein